MVRLAPKANFQGSVRQLKIALDDPRGRGVFPTLRKLSDQELSLNFPTACHNRKNGSTGR